MKRIRFSPLERMFLKTCRSRKDAVTLLKTFRREIEFPSEDKVFLPIGLLFRFVLMVGIKRNPTLYLFWGFVSLLCYILLVIKLFK